MPNPYLDSPACFSDRLDFFRPSPVNAVLVRPSSRAMKSSFVLMLRIAESLSNLDAYKKLKLPDTVLMVCGRYLNRVGQITRYDKA